ncbi:hypothetical protein ACP4OV_013785 [Aristida adscensionis]
MSTDSGGGGGGEAKRQRAHRQAEGEVPVDRISALPDELRQQIVTLLPFVDAVRSGALARGWRVLWKSCWPRHPSVDIRLDGGGGAPERELAALEREPRPRRRLHRFSLVVESRTRKFRSSHLQRFLDYAAECRVEDLRVEMSQHCKLKFHLPHSSPLLARLSLYGLGISSINYKGAQPFHALEVIELQWVSTTPAAFRKMVALCPSLRTLHLRHCESQGFFFWEPEGSMVWPASLRSVTVACCNGMANLESAPSLRSFRYKGSFLDAPFSLPRDAALAELCIRFQYSVSGSHYTSHFNNSLPNDLSRLTVFTICHNALPVAGYLSDDGAPCQVPKQRSLHSLRELQLFMLKMEAANLADIYVFLKTFQFPNLERLFVQFAYCANEASHDEVGAEPPENFLGNVKIVKVKYFHWHPVEVEFVSFLLRKASSLHKLLLVSSHKAAPLDVPGVQEADLLLLKDALTNGKMILSKSDDAATQPYHSEAFLRI